MDSAPRTVGPDTQPDPNQDRPGNPTPARIMGMILLVHALNAYGRYLAELISQPTLWRGFTTVARFFGTPDVLDIIPRIQRGIMRAAALEAMLRRRAESGADLVVAAASISSTRKAPLPAPRPEHPPEPKTPRPLLTLGNLPTAQEIEAEVRRRPIGRTIAAICLDLAISPSLCTGPFWNALFEAIQDYRGSLTVVITEFGRREDHFDTEDWQSGDLPWPERTREGVREVLGFLIGEDPFQPAPAGAQTAARHQPPSR
jgi:hypothetical protein